MTKGEAKVLETDTVLFPLEFRQNKQETVSAKEPANGNATVVKQSVRTDFQIRFARLKKSLRKRSASIL